MNIDRAREVLTEVMHKYFTDTTYGHYIANELAGDFAAELAEAFIAMSPATGITVTEGNQQFTAQTADRAVGGECDWVTSDNLRTYAPSCGMVAKTHLQPSTATIFCPYCGRKIHVKES